MRAQIPLAGVIGDPIGHSKSPRLHGHWLSDYGLAGHYIPMQISAGDLPEALKTLPKLGFKGINVTIPHKETALSLANEVTDAAARIGAANTLTFREDGTFQADNTDGYGFIQTLISTAPSWQADTGPAAVLGAGGACRAIIVALLDAGCPEIRLSNRTKDRAEGLARQFGPKIKVVDWGQEAALFYEVALAVNTTSLGMEGQPPFEFALDGLPNAALATDLIYTPLNTPFLQAASEKGCATVDGLGMLLHQAVPGFDRWFGKRPEVTDALRDIVLAA
jgi:shikimate dehydrogenase